MLRDFAIRDGIYLEQAPHELDLHNNFVLHRVEYCMGERRLTLDWRASTGDWVPAGTPPAVSVDFLEVSDFRFFPRDSRFPPTEDDCVDEWGYWTEEEWANGQVVSFEPDERLPDPRWLMGIQMMSGTIIAVQAASAHARISLNS